MVVQANAARVPAGGSGEQVGASGGGEEGEAAPPHALQSGRGGNSLQEL